MAAPPTVPIPANIAELTGPLLLGYFFNWALFGCLSVQAYIYYLAFPRDRLWPTKALAYGVFMFEFIQVIIATYDAFRYFGTAWGNMIELDKVGLVWFSVVVQGAIVAAIGQAFYAWRIWILSEKWYLSAVIIVLALVQSIAGIYDADQARKFNSWIKVTTELKVITPIWLGGTALCDLIVAVAMTWCLWNARSGWKHTNTIILKIVALTVETGMVCAAVAILDLALYLAYPESNYHLTPALALSKLYSNSLFAVLNARVRIQGGRQSDGRDKDPTLSTSGHYGGSGGARHALSTHLKTANSPGPYQTTFAPFSAQQVRSGGDISVSVTREMHRDADLDSEELPMKTMSSQYKV